MVLTGDLLQGISQWMEDEYGDGLEWTQDEDGEYILFGGDTLDRIGFAYSTYENDVPSSLTSTDYHRVSVDEQWYADARNLRVWLELDGRAVEEYTLNFGDEEGMLRWFEEYAVYDELIGEADGYINEHMEEYEHEA